VSAPALPRFEATPAEAALGRQQGRLTPAQEARVRRLLLVMRRPVAAALSGAYRSLVRGSGIEFEEVRPYLPGDEVRGIDWNVTARTGEPYVKTYREERQLELQLLVDVSSSMDFGTAEASKREKAAELCALLAAASALSRDALAADLFAGGLVTHVPKARSASHWARLNYAVLSAAGGPATAQEFAAAAAGLRRHLRRRHALFVISDFLGYDEVAWEQELGSLAQQHDVALCRLVDAFEEQLPAAGLLWLVDPESGGHQELDTNNAKVRAAWARRAEERRAEFERRAARFGLPHFTLRTDQATGEALLAFLKRAARRARAGGWR
jgi:uncharacterized protein (DUF58 family)